MFMKSTSFFGYVFVVNNIIPYFEVTSFFIGSYHFNTYKNKLILIYFLIEKLSPFHMNGLS